MKKEGTVRAQYAMEFMLVFAFSLVVILPVISLLNSQYQESRTELDQVQAEDVLDELSIVGQRVHFSGYPSRSTVELVFPRDVTEFNRTNVNIGKGNRSAVYLELDRLGTHVNVTRVFPYHVEIDVVEGFGKKRILVKSEKGGYVNFTEVR